MIHWDRTPAGDLFPRAAPLPVAAASDVREGVVHLDAQGTLRLPSASAVLAGVRYGPDAGWVGILSPSGSGEIVVPPDVDDGWGRLRVLLRARLAGLSAWLGDARGVSAVGAAGPRVLPAAVFDVAAEDGSVPSAGFFRVALRLRLAARETSALDRLAQAASDLLAGWSLDDGRWRARGFVLAAQEDHPSSEPSPDRPVLERALLFRFRAWRLRADDSE